MLDKIKQGLKALQLAFDIDGGLYVDLFAIVFIVRLIAPLFHFPPVTFAEAGMWGATIGTYGYSKGGPKSS
jgi:hypothetical protein